MTKKHVTVVGAGPAGLMAAEVLATAGVSVNIIDHHRSPARKFLLAGRGGLNLTNSEPLPKFLMRYRNPHPDLISAIEAFPPEAIIAWCHELGVETFVGSSGRVFPKGLKASHVLRAWLKRLDALGVTLQSSKAWEGFTGVPTILAMGGASWPELGSDAKWMSYFKKEGVSVAPFKASNGRQLVNWSEDFRSRFKGQPIKNISATSNGMTVRGEAMISEDGIEGGAVYALSHKLAAGGALHFDLKPDLSESIVSTRMALRGKESRSNFLRKRFSLSPAAIALMRETGSTNPKAVIINLAGPAPIARAISSSGGVSFSELDNFQLRKQPGAFLAGEMLDWDAPTGGYLLQACFATGVAAAKTCLKSLS